MNLSDLRQRLDAIDDQIIALLRERANLAQGIGRSKEAAGLPVYAPERESQVLERIASAELGVFPADGAQAVFREIMSACRSLQERPHIAYLGPAGTFAEIAARDMFGTCATYLPLENFDRVFEAVTSGAVHYGLVPVENSTAGTIREVLDLLAQTSLSIVGETYVDVHHCLLSHAELDEIRLVYSKDSALDQCRGWLRRNLPNARPVAVPSTADGASRAAAEPTAAAIATARAAEVYQLPLRARDIEDRSDNRTRFFALGHNRPGATGHDKTSLLLAVTHRPGALADVLDVLRRHRLNMTLIESRPSPNAAFEYLFFIDVEGHRDDEQVQGALADVAEVCLMVQVLGSYPRAT